MTLKTFDRVNVSTKTHYTVFRGENYVYDFTADYCEDSQSLFKLVHLKKQGAVVRFVTVNSATGLLEVTVDIE